MSSKRRPFFYIHQLEQLVRLQLESTLNPLGITAGQYMILSLISHHEPISSAELSRLVRITAQSMGEFIKYLESKDWILRREDPCNKRVLLIETTIEGRVLLRRCEQEVGNLEKEFFKSVPAQELVLFEETLKRLSAG
ncbi:MarR family transcriptional regulator [Advenella sp. WQ 585]|uniref:MarR family transcriptional regulator n=2 Tax=Advenella TaxID=290425 RepID=A0ABS6NKD4_9BURK|nr:MULTISPECIES: MarR family transcriptional regulator [Advenella]MBK1781767.1 MarR family transcriptional regulator [Advenella mandrilli]MBV4396093.1 MarR family transcriptional regulator [Advenella alkanexedens]